MGETVAILGAGKMGEALMSGLIRSGHSVDELVFVERHDDRADALTAQYRVAREELPGAVQRADTLLVAVKPQETTVLLDQLAQLATSDKLVISIVAGIPCATFEKHLADGTPVVRVMPNTPALVDEAMSAVSAGTHATEEHLRRAEALFAPVGKVVEVAENQLDAVTALSGSGPAYFFYFVEAMVEAGIQLGLPRALAQDLAIQTAIGAAVMMRDSGDEPNKLRENVTSPGGTTAAALRTMDERGVRAALMAALEAARDRSRELASGQS
jgi:pyrroline-5-carboxylate reductase